MKRNIIILIIAIIAIAALLGFIATRNPTPSPSENARLMSIEDYVKNNISTLSSEKEQVGGTFYVTAIEAHGGAGTVSYEDGHNGYTADFTYTTDENTGYTITSFKVRE
jgi:hypothetical protein